MRPDRNYCRQEVQLLVERLYLEESLPLEVIISALASELGTILGASIRSEALEAVCDKTANLMKDFALNGKAA